MSLQLSMTMPATHYSNDLPIRDRSLAVAMVVLAHALLLWFYVASPGQSRSAPREMSVSMALPAPPQAVAVEKKTQIKPVPVKPVPVIPEPAPQAAAPEIPAEAPAQPQAVTSTAQPENTSPTLADREPDYQAAYLNNPKPVYPMVARRMGWQGRVVVNVEVLENGMPGQVILHQSSGREVLDIAAMQAVRGWKFVAARQNGQTVAKWFLVPIPFILKESE